MLREGKTRSANWTLHNNPSVNHWEIDWWLIRGAYLLQKDNIEPCHWPGKGTPPPLEPHGHDGTQVPGCGFALTLGKTKRGWVAAQCWRLLPQLNLSLLFASDHFKTNGSSFSLFTVSLLICNGCKLFSLIIVSELKKRTLESKHIHAAPDGSTWMTF